MGYARVKCLCSKKVSKRTKTYQGNVVYEVEAHVGEGLPGIFIIGLKEQESIVTREIIRAAITMQGFILPRQKITVSVRLINDQKDTLSAKVSDLRILAPSSEVTSAIAIAILSASRQMRALKSEEYLVGKQLTLNGRMTSSPDAMDDDGACLRGYVEELNRRSSEKIIEHLA